jgi:hypothetical protein
MNKKLRWWLPVTLPKIVNGTPKPAMAGGVAIRF